MKDNRVCSLLGIKYPIIQGAMAWIADGNLAGHVSKEGGLGIIAGGGMPLDILRAEIRKAKAITSNPFGVNLMLMMPNVGEQIDICIEEGVKVVTTGAGNPGIYMEKLKAAGIKVIPVVSPGHPDKVSDQISDAVLDACLANDPDSRVACEVFCTTGQVIVGGEITTKTYVDIQDIVRKKIDEIGYKPGMGFDSDCGVLNAIHSQSPDIGM